MELELGLTLSNTPPKIPILKELDLISFVNCKGKQVYEEDNCSTLSSQSSVIGGDYGEEEVINDGFSQFKEDNNKNKKKRVFDEIFEVESCIVSMSKTLPLFLWDKHPNEDHQQPKRLCNSSSFIINKIEDDSIVGWPPIKSYRKRLNDQYRHQQRRHDRNFPAMENGGRGVVYGRSRSMFVKVQIEGFFITRKIDLKLYNSYQALISSLLTMFAKGQESMDDYELTYQDINGDWLLARDVPWRYFMDSVQRLKLRRRDD
ncbi:auxin-responsive protein IAA28-like [Amaranthus tricolor]|uniref:auxin-responsive protein IAA28-like n=1 Tax=Amaranthus tricolor TaxID=29722 RepID=UPI00258BA7D4|nr:auxin-responsive protein IAA28-like [Amaranthus tricolor]